MEAVKIGIIGGSGIYDIEGFSDVKTIAVETPFGEPSDRVIIGTLSGVRFAFLPRHGRGHTVSPTELNFRANIYALKVLGVEQVISVSAVGSLKEELKPRDFVIPDQLFDRTKDRPSTFFSDGIVAHVGFADPFCPHLSKLAYNTAQEVGISVHKGGTYVCIEGPQFSTRAESNVYRRLGFSIIGMTNIPEAKLAREAEMCYVTVALVTDYDVWKEDEEVSVETVIANLNANTENAKKFIKTILPKIKNIERCCKCDKALANAIITAGEFIPKKTLDKLKPLIEKYIT
ncbi:MAG: S-methyl-5'-thioadenosine phosphorylase [Candidatus Omnitrophica bacterium]|nr:S-methyl-5'-thioadenosine phosphorylase [Candidatus Omnitrophota bacterium]MCG2703995.1 S-methyl-5'-thioadenosine phosphorylase [Candidatus Omnitrophota bacterium]